MKRLILWLMFLSLYAGLTVLLGYGGMALVGKSTAGLQVLGTFLVLLATIFFIITIIGLLFLPMLLQRPESPQKQDIKGKQKEDIKRKEKEAAKENFIFDHKWVAEAQYKKRL